MQANSRLNAPTMQGPVATWIRRSFPEHPQLCKKLSVVVRLHPGPLLASSFCSLLFVLFLVSFVLESFVCFVWCVFFVFVLF